MKFISLAVMALLGTSQAINLRSKDMEEDDQVAADVTTQLSAEGGEGQ